MASDRRQSPQHLLQIFCVDKSKTQEWIGFAGGIMRITEIDLQCEDIMWFGVDNQNHIFACTSAGCGNVPEFVCKSKENTTFLECLQEEIEKTKIYYYLRFSETMPELAWHRFMTLRFTDIICRILRD